MTEQSVFLAALEYDDPGERSAYLDRACAGDAALRAGVEQLLTAHERSGAFLGQPAPARLAGDPAAEPGGDGTRTGPAPDADDGLDFLEPSDKPGSIGRVGHYEVREVVGRGGMGVVLKAFDEQLHRVVAIKVMAPQLATSATARKRFVREARAQAAVTHEHVVTTHAVDESGPLPHIVMQFVAGQSLQDRLDRTGPLQLQEVLRIGMQAASGLAAAHAQGLVHRDVKPANILLENGVERVKLTDFGLARAADDASLTQSGAVAGTPQYMSPEQAEGRPVDARSDLFSLGSVLYAMCTGRPPFRAGTGMGVLKRVCEDAPTPVREANPEVPDWLAAVAEKLHAKNPSDRYQSAAEVAEVLGRHLAHVQHPSVVPLSAVAKTAGRPPAPERPARRHRRAVAAAALVAVLAILGTTEATGVTNVRAAVVRVFTPDGTLVVETDDPAVRVTVEGDGDLVITGAGPQEVRLKAGSYRLKATRDGKAVTLDRDLVAISRGDRQVVRVRLEDEPPVAVVPKAGPGAFVLLGGKGVAERKFNTLAEAVLGSADGDTIEVRGDGPFMSEPMKLQKTALTIRAGAGCRPVINLSPQWHTGHHLIWTNSPLVLEGLVIKGGHPAMAAVHATAAIRAANCRFRSAISTQDSAVCVLRNCEFSEAGVGAGHNLRGAQFRTDNCLYWSTQAAVTPNNPAELQDILIEIRRTTFVSRGSFAWLSALRFPLAKPSDPAPAEIPVRFVADECIFDVGSMFGFALTQAHLNAAVPEPAAGEATLRQLVGWRGKRNLFAPGRTAFQWWGDPNKQPLGPKSLEDWKRFWPSPETDSREGSPRFHGGLLLARADLDQLTPEDFRLRPDSAGFRAGKDGKDLGADVDLVGPGAAYGRWKMTPDYQQWLRDTGQVKK